MLSRFAEKALVLLLRYLDPCKWDRYAVPKRH